MVKKIKYIPVRREIHIPMRHKVYYCDTPDSVTYEQKEWDDEWTLWELEKKGSLPSRLQEKNIWKNVMAEWLKNVYEEQMRRRHDLDNRPSLCLKVIIDKANITFEEELEEVEEIPTKKIPPKDIIEKKERLERIIRQKKAELEKLEKELEQLEEEYEFKE